MPTAEFLTDEELAILTGLERKSAQIKWLSDKGWNFITNAAGFPIVSRLYCRQKMAGEIATARIDEMPNFGAIK